MLRHLIDDIYTRWSWSKVHAPSSRHEGRPVGSAPTSSISERICVPRCLLGEDPEGLGLQSLSDLIRWNRGTFGLTTTSCLPGLRTGFHLGCRLGRPGRQRCQHWRYGHRPPGHEQRSRRRTCLRQIWPARDDQLLGSGAGRSHLATLNSGRIGLGHLAGHCGCVNWR